MSESGEIPEHDGSALPSGDTGIKEEGEDNGTEEAPATESSDTALPEASDGKQEPAPDGAKSDNAQTETSSSDRADKDVAKSLKEEDQSEGDDVGAPSGDDVMDTEGENTTPVAAEQSSVSKELPYSTRGRSSDKDKESSSGPENWERSAREGLEDVGRVKESSTALGVSFLESLGEEERRTRTRHLPDVEGFNGLRKGEIKDDLGLARTLVSAVGVTTLKKAKSKKAKDDDTMEVDEDDGASPSEDGSSDIARLGATTIELPSRDIVVPSNAFVSMADGEGGSKSSKNAVQSPSEVESVTAFNPPRPPESIGAKKKHRMLRWERRPEDVEADLNKYRKTVQRTRQEVLNAESEYSRLQTMDAHLRWHFMGHLDLLNQEYLRLTQEMGAVQDECVKEADLLTARTRTRGAGKGSYVMRDIMTVLKARGTEESGAVPMNTTSEPMISNPVQGPGVGGLALSTFGDWDRETSIIPKSPASAWIVPGEMVSTPYGEGEVLKVLPPQTVFEKKDEEETQQATDKDNGKTEKTKKTKDAADKKPECITSVLPPRVSVKLDFGVGHFPMDAVTPLENPTLMSDVKLVNRWKNMVDTALTVGPCLDLEGMASKFVAKDEAVGEAENEDSSQMELDDGNTDGSRSENGIPSARTNADHFLPFGSNLLPTSTGRGNLLYQLSMEDIEKGANHGIFNGGGLLGDKSNPGLTSAFRTMEDDEQEFLELQSSLAQLRTSLIRQRRIRLHNERTNSITADRYRRAEDLVVEMRSDLKSLKQRLVDELTELGIDETSVEAILFSFYSNAGVPADGGDTSPLKRSRRSINREDEVAEGDRESVDFDMSGDEMEAQQPAKKKSRPTQ